MERKLFYERPEAELLVVRFEERFLQDSPQYNTSGNQKLVIDPDDVDL